MIGGRAPSLAAGRAPTAVSAVLLGAVVLGAAVLRFVDLGSNPGGLYPDEAAEGLDALRLLSVRGFHPVFFPDDGGREALFGYLVAAVFFVAGDSALTLRATAAGIGVIAVVAIWLLARGFGRWTGLAAAAWAAGSLWLVCVSRDGMRNTLVPLLGALALAALIAWSDRPSRRTAVLAGATASLAALYTYQPLKLLPLLVVAWLLWLRRVDSQVWSQLRPSLAILAGTFALVAIPMGLAAVSDPLNYFGRAAAVTPFNPMVDTHNSLIAHWLRTLGMFAVTGDPNARHDVAELPLLGVPLTVAGLAGLARLWRMRRDGPHALVLWSLPVFLLPPLFAVEGGAPHFLRTLGLAAPLAVTIGLGLAELVERAAAASGDSARRMAAGATIGALVLLGVGSGMAYLTRPVADRYAAFSNELVAIAERARAASAPAVILDAHSAITVRFLAFHANPPVVIISPGSRLPEATTYDIVIARSRDDLAGALGPSLAAGAQPIAFDPGGRPSAWSVPP
ncbi:MAG TPA: glycosyltransferase family 39 protein [Nonomuraea sp.]|nr:glycosyltransferase family 39 protein [Nonomuraea sp.]